MRKLVLGLIVIITVFSCKNENDKNPSSGFTINGYIQNIDSEKAYLFDADNKIIDSSFISNNSFCFDGEISKPIFAYVSLKKDGVSVPFILENYDYQLYSSPGKQLIYGGKLQKTYNNYQEGLESLEKTKLLEINNFNPKLKYSLFQKKIDSINKEILEYNFMSLEQIDFAPIKNEIILNILNTSSLDTVQYISLQNTAKDLNSLKLVALIKSKLDEIKAIALINEINKSSPNVDRQKAPMFSGESLNGSDLGLASVLNGKKAVLIDFWASWCGPCREVTPEIRYLYNKYKNKGFDIVTVSEDKNRSAWKSGLSKDQILMWNHIYDDNMRIAYMYNVSSIPHMVLLDGNGGIIDRKISVNNLKKELAAICK